MHACYSKNSNDGLGYGARSVSYAASVLWNDLCDDGLTRADSVAEFKAGLKTHLFNKYFQRAILSPPFLALLLYSV